MRSVINDRTAGARIRDAAMGRFAADGFQRATVRAIAADAAVSPALVLHHFGSKSGLREACDEYVVQQVTDKVEPWLKDPASHIGQPGALGELFGDAQDIVTYIGRGLVEGGDRTDQLVDRFIDLTEEMLAEAERAGTIQPTSDPRARAAVIVLWDLVTIVLQRHLARALGEDDAERILLRYGTVAVEMFEQGLLQPKRKEIR